MKTASSVKSKAKASKAKAPRASAKSKKANDTAFRKVIGTATLIGAGIGALLGSAFA
jgi:hypothetical protein